ncbi:MAG: DNRLRE domain-containing protein [Chitinophagales bacterium]
MKQFVWNLLFPCIFLYAPILIYAQTTVTLTPSADASIGFQDFTNSANTNYGYADHYSAFSQAGAFGGENAGHGIMKFDLSQVPLGAMIISADLNLFGRGPYGVGDAVSVGDTGDNVCYLERITSDWDEFTVTWNTQPSTTSQHAVTIGPSTSASEDFLNIDVKDLVQDMVSFPSNSFGFSLRLVTEDPTRSLAFWSSDATDSAKFPHLTISYLCVGGTFTFYPVSDASIGFQDFTNSANTNYGNADHYSAFSQPGAFGGENAGAGIMKFDLSAIPSSSTITNAYLNLYGKGPFGIGEAASIGNVGSNECYLLRITSDWDENTVTWNTQPTTSTLHQIILPQSTSVSQDYLNIEVTQMIEDYVSDPNSFGLELKLVTEDTTRALAFWSTDGIDSSLWQKLTVQYVCGKQSGIDEILDGRNLEIFPNPTGSQITINYSGKSPEAKFQITLLDELGRMVLSRVVNNSSSASFQYIINLTELNLSNGLYMIKLESGSNMISKKFIFMKSL